jgi:hypothetical protein
VEEKNLFVDDQKVNPALPAMWDEVLQRKKDQDDSMLFLGNAAKTYLAASSFLISIVGTFQLVSPKIDPTYTVIYNILVGFSILIYCGLVFYSIKGFMPVEMFSEFPSDYTGLRDSFWGKPEEDIILQKISNYIDAADKNMALIAQRTRYIRVGGILLAANVILLLSMALIPRV